MTSRPKPTIDASAPADLIRGENALVTLSRRAVDTPLYLVGGSVRDALLGQRPLDLDIAVDGPVAPLASGLDPDAVSASFELLLEFARRPGRLVVCVFHDPQLNARADRHFRLVEGRLEAFA